MHALSQVVFADADTAVAIVSAPGILAGLVSMIHIGSTRPSARIARDISTLAVNNCAGIGGEEASAKIASEPGMLNVLKDMVLSGSDEEKTRGISVCYHISRAPSAQQLMADQGFPALLLQILSSTPAGTGGEDPNDAYKGLATMTLANLIGATPRAPISAASVEFTVTFLGYALKGQRFSGINWRVDDVLHSLLELSNNAAHHAALSKAGTVQYCVRILQDWRPGSFESHFTRAKAARVPILEKVSRLLINLAATPDCLEGMRRMGAVEAARQLQDKATAQVVANYIATLLAALQPPTPKAAPPPPAAAARQAPVVESSLPSSKPLAEQARQGSPVAVGAGEGERCGVGRQGAERQRECS